MSTVVPDLRLTDALTVPSEKAQRFLWGGLEAGLRWIANAPDILGRICDKHAITDLRFSPELRLNLVLFGESAPHGPVVIKMAPPNHEVESEIAALRAFAATGTYVRLIDADVDAGWQLQERILPGRMLQEIAQAGELSDAEATQVIANLMRDTATSLSVAGATTFPDLHRWLRSLWSYAASGKSVIPREQVELALRHGRAMVNDQAPPMLLHGDFHHGNILQGPDGWTLIDPKGIAAPAAFEIGPSFYNPIGVDKRSNLAALFDRRLDIFSKTLGIDRMTLWRNALVACVLSDCWSFESEPVHYCHHATVTAALMELPERFA